MRCMKRLPPGSCWLKKGNCLTTGGRLSSLFIFSPSGQGFFFPPFLKIILRFSVLEYHFLENHLLPKFSSQKVRIKGLPSLCILLRLVLNIIVTVPYKEGDPYPATVCFFFQQIQFYYEILKVKLKLAQVTETSDISGKHQKELCLFKKH